MSKSTLSKTNQNKARHGRLLIQYHRGVLQCDKGTPAYDYLDVGSLLADILHLCNLEGINFDEALRLGRQDFTAEINSEDDWMDES